MSAHLLHIYRRLPLRLCLLLALPLLAIALPACGDSAAPEPPPAAGPGAPGAPDLLERELEPGEVMVEGEASPRRHGPFDFDGRYSVAFAQYAPEAPRRGFGDEVPFVAELRSVADPRARPLALFHEAAREGSKTLELQGRYEVEVLFGDFPYVIRFTPQS